MDSSPWTGHEYKQSTAIAPQSKKNIGRDIFQKSQLGPDPYQEKFMSERGAPFQGGGSNMMGDPMANL